jgi:hypothetical protein
LASTGFGYGDDEGIGGTERLMGIFTEELSDNTTANVTVGKALLEAKQYYYTSTSPWTVYDEKSSIQFTLYGLPQYAVGAAGESSSPSMMSQETSPVSTVNLVLNIQDGETSYSSNHNLQLVTTDSGSYYTADGDTQATAFRPVQPRVVFDELPLIDLPPDPDQLDRVQGVLITGGNFTDYDGFDPVLVRPTNDAEPEADEVQIVPPTFWPSEIAVDKTLETMTQLIQNIVVIPGQFRSTGIDSDNQVIGIQRLYNKLDLELLRGTNVNDFEPPLISNIELMAVSDNTVAVTVEASDPSGIAQIVILNIHNGEITSTSETYPALPQSGNFTIDVPIYSPDYNLVIQVSDGKFVAIATGKGANLSTILVDSVETLGYYPDNPVYFKATVHDFVEISEGLTAPVFFTWKFGDGSTFSGLLSPEALQTVNVVVHGDGSASFMVQHTYSDTAPLEMTASVKVTDANGGIGVDETLVQRWWDLEDAIDPDADLIGGYAFNDESTMTITLLVSQAGDPLSGEFQYRIKLNLEGSSYHLKYNDGKITGLSSLQVTPNVNELIFTFDLADIGAVSGDYMLIATETQAGVKAESETGIVDEMPDEGTFDYIVY